MKKRSLRQHFIKIRASIEADSARAWSKQMAEYLLVELSRRSFNGTLFIYSAIKGEPDLLSHLRECEYPIALPRAMDSGAMDFHLWSASQQLSPGKFGIEEPSDGALLVFPCPGDVAIVPAVAIDAEGHRLGWGAGYYDRWLSAHRPKFLFIAGAVFPPCLSRNLFPNDPHDIAVDFCLKTDLSV